jgi:hypothetical protein
MPKEIERPTGTYFLESADEGTSENGKSNRTTDGNSLPGERRRRNKRELQRKHGERRALTSWRKQMEEQVRMAKETERPTGTHFLENADGGIS